MENYVKGTDDAVYAMWFGIKFDKELQKIVIVNCFTEKKGKEKWGNSY